MENRRIEKIMYMKFNNRDKHASLMGATKGGLIVVNKSFKQTLNDVINERQIEHDNALVKDASVEVALIWQAHIHNNYIKTRREMKW